MSKFLQKKKVGACSDLRPNNALSKVSLIAFHKVKIYSIPELRSLSNSLEEILVAFSPSSVDSPPPPGWPCSCSCSLSRPSSTSTITHSSILNLMNQTPGITFGTFLFFLEPYHSRSVKISTYREDFPSLNTCCEHSTEKPWILTFLALFSISRSLS